MPQRDKSQKCYLTFELIWSGLILLMLCGSDFAVHQSLLNVNSPLEITLPVL